jgi:hypothetical protein
LSGKDPHLYKSNGSTKITYDKVKKMVKCESCGVDVREGAKFCSNCGVAVAGSVKEEIKVSSDDLVGKVKELLRESDITRLIVQNEKGKTLLEIPVWAGVVGVVLAPWLAALGAIGAIATDCTIKVVRRE